MEVTGTIKEIKETAYLTDKFRKRDIIITIDGKYPQDVLFQVINDMCEEAGEYKLGDTIKAQFNLMGREWTNPQTGEVKHFNTLQIWSIIFDDVVKLKNNNTFATGNPKVQGNIEKRFEDDAIDNMTEDDDLPF